MAIGAGNNVWALVTDAQASAGAGNFNLALARAYKAVADATGGNGIVDIQPPFFW
ncbi:hypothetical protein OSJ16_10200 [Mycobacterium ulcerans]